MTEKNAAIASIKKFVEEKAIYSDDVIETNSGKILECIRFIEHVVHDVVVVVCGRDHVNYVSSNCRSILGIDHVYLRSLSLIESIDVIHPDDVIPFKRCIEKLTKVTETAYDQFKFIIQYRMKGQNGRFLSVQDEKFAIKTTPKKFVFITLLRNISSEGAFFGVKLMIQKKKGDKFITIDEFFPASAARVLSPRQVDIVNLVARGFSNKAIAEQLSLSLSTVKNHKQMLFKKINVKNNIEMLSSFQILPLQNDQY